MADEPTAPPSKDTASQSAALSNLSDSHTGDPSSTSSPADPSSADTAKLAGALSGLSVADKANPSKSEANEKKEADKPAKKVKIAAEDVTYLVEQLDVSKSVATGMLRGSEGQRDAAIEAWVVPKVKT